MKSAKSRIKNCKRRGEWAELQFLATAAKHGLQVCKPLGDSARYDAVVENQGAFVRVQVKSTTCRKPPGYYICGVRPSLASAPYKRGEFDFLACYVIPEDLWYIIPAKVVLSGVNKSAILLFTASPASRYAPYKEAWELLRRYRRRTSVVLEPDQAEISEVVAADSGEGVSR
jgi:PD-(D/E)XK endonuclease